jgi:hypothetical protein
VNQAAAPILHISLASTVMTVTHSITTHSSRAVNLVGLAALKGTLPPRPSSVDVSESAPAEE